MKQTNLLKTFLLLCALVVGSTCAWADDPKVTFTFSDIAEESGWTSGTAYTKITIAPITVNADGGGNNGKWYTSGGGSWRMYSGGTVRITAATGYAVTEVTSSPDCDFDIIDGEATFSPISRTDFTEITVTYSEVAVPKHNVTFSINGATTTSELAEGADIVFPANPAAIGGKTFMGWITTSIDGATDTAPASYIETSSQKVGNADITYYAVFAGTKTGTTTITDVLNRALTGVAGTTYTEWSGKTVVSDAVYAGKSAGGNESIQLRSSGSSEGIVTTTSGGIVKKIVVNWNSNTAADRQLDIYGKNTAYSSAADLFGDSKGTLLGSIVKGTSTELTVDGDYSFIGLRSNSGAMYLSSVSIDWEATGTIYSAYCTTVTTTATVTAAGWATYVTPYNMEFAEGDAFVVSTANATTATLTGVTKIRANQPVLLKGEGVKTATVLNEAPAAAVANELAISTGGEIDGFVLAKKNDKVGFYKWNGGSLTSGKVYLPAPAGARDYLEFSFDETTALTLVNSEKRTVNSDIYNLAGQRVANPTKGLYIVNGKKVVIK